jgi:hypothetical protein
VATTSGDVIWNVVGDDGIVHKLILRDVLYCPDIRVNLISVSAAQTNGYSIVFPEYGGCTITNTVNGECIYSTNEHCRLYSLDVVASTNENGETI